MGDGMKRIGLIDVDGHNYPNLPLMKISAWHKKQGDSVEWYDPWIGLIDEYDKEHCDPIYKKLQRWCSNYIFWSVPTFDEYLKGAT